MPSLVSNNTARRAMTRRRTQVTNEEARVGMAPAWGSPAADGDDRDRGCGGISGCHGREKMPRGGGGGGND